MEALQKMKAKPKMIYTDDEKAIASSDFKQYVEDEGIELYRTRGHPAFSERFIRTFKDKLFKRVEADENKGKGNIQWIDYILEKCSHITTKMSTHLLDRPQTRQEKRKMNSNQR